jgi:hypothetical protein
MQIVVYVYMPLIPNLKTSQKPIEHQNYFKTKIWVFCLHLHNI